MNAPAVDPGLLYAVGLHFRAAAAAVNHYFGEGVAESNPSLVVTVARLIGERARARELREGLAEVCGTLRALNVNESLDGVRRSVEGLQEEVSAVAVAIIEMPV